MTRIKVAAAHVAPVFLELGATIEKTCSIISRFVNITFISYIYWIPLMDIMT